MGTLLKQAMDIYRDIDELREQEGGKVVDAIDQVSFSRYIESDPDNHPVNIPFIHIK